MIQFRCRSAAAVLLLPALVLGQGIVVPGPVPVDRIQVPIPLPVETGLLRVETAIVDGAATTELEQTLENRSNAPQEAYWLLPLPPGATADRFTMTVGGVEQKGEVLDAQKARGIYEEIVRKRRDPGLLEYLGTGLLRARVFPIPPLGTVKVRVRYAEMLAQSGSVTTFRFPLRAAWADGRGPQRFALAIDIRSKAAIKTVWSPLSGLEIARDGDHHVRAGFECGRAAQPPRDLALHYGIADQDFGVHVLPYRQQGEAGYFLMLLAPKRDWPAQPDLARSINLVLDTSGSMAGEKIRQARAAVRTFLQSLSGRDWFNVIPFSTDARPFFPEPRLATAANLAEALAKVDQIEARGGTNIEDALTLAMRTATPDCSKGATGSPAIVPITVFLTDGLPTVGTTDVDALLAAVQRCNTNKARIFVFGVGSDVNTRLLDTLAQASRGDRDYVQPGEDIEHKTGVLFSKLSGPVMTDLQLEVDGVQVDAQEPRLLPDLFVQGQLTVVGRYRGEGRHAVRLRGMVGRDRHEYVFEADFPAADAANDWLPTLWAQRRVATLLDAIRLHGQDPELVAEVTRLGRDYGIVTPYTSHLIVEEGMQLARFRGATPGSEPTDPATLERLRREWGRLGAQPAPDAGLPAVQAAARDEASRAAQAMAQTAETGASAVDKSKELRLLTAGGLVRADGAVALLYHRIGSRSFHLVGGVWVDAAFRPELQARLRKVTAFSGDYFALLQARPELAPVLAFSTRIVVVLGDEPVEIVE